MLAPSSMTKFGTRPDCANVEFDLMIVRAGIERRIRPYDLRHAFATMCLDAGADLKCVAEIMGHADETMIVRYYRHTNATALRAAVNAAPGLLGGNDNGSS